MNSKLFIHFVRWLGVLFATAILAAFDSASPELREAKTLVQGAPVDVVSSHSAAKKPFVYLIGENHASVANQIELAKLLKILHREAGVKTFLVEGSSGTFPLEKIRADLDLGSRDRVRRHLWEQLEWGRIAGYEFVALATPDVVVHGIEDMIAKRLYDIGQTEYGSPSMRLVMEWYRIGAQRLREALKALEKLNGNSVKTASGSPDIEDLSVAISAYEDSIASYERKLQESSEARRAFRDREREYALLWCEAEPVFERYGNDLAKIKDLEEELKFRAEIFEIYYEKYNRLKRSGPSSLDYSELEKYLSEAELFELYYEKYNRLKRSGPSSLDYSELEKWLSEAEIFELYYEKYNRLKRSGPSSLDYSELEKWLEEIQKIKAYLKRAEDRFFRLKLNYDEFITNEYPKIQALNDFWREPSAEETKAVESTTASVNEAAAKLEDRYFVAANRIQAIGGPLGIDLAPTQRFWLERDEWIRERLRDTAEDDLRDRDVAMGKNSRRYMNKHRLNTAAVIVGDNHLPGMATQFREDDIGFIGLRLRSSNADLEPWERHEWAARQIAHEGSIYTGERLKERSPLLDPKWRASEIARFKLFENLQGIDHHSTPSIRGLVGDGRVYEGVLDSDRVILTSQTPFDRNAQFGDHVLDRGPMPAHPGKFYQVIDRKRAKEQVHELSDSRTSFAYAYQTTATGTTSYEIVTPAGKVSVGEFRDSPPLTMEGSVPERVVLFRESDEIERDGIVVSPLLDRMRMSETPIGQSSPNNPSPVEPLVESPVLRPVPKDAGDLKTPKKDGERTALAATEAEPSPISGSDGGGKPPNKIDPPGPESQSGGGAGSGGGGKGPGPGASADDYGRSWKPPPGSSGSRSYWSHPWLAAMRANKPRMYQTINPQRAKRNLAMLDRQQGSVLGKVEFIDEKGLASLPFSPRDGLHARTVVFHASNTREFRHQVKEAAKRGKLRNKQVSLITCGDAFVETTELREAFLEGGAIAVWGTERQLQVQQGRTLYEYVKQTTEELGSEARSMPVDELMMRALQKWQRENPRDPAIRIFEQSGTWVRLEGGDNSPT